MYACSSVHVCVCVWVCVCACVCASVCMMLMHVFIYGMHSMYLKCTVLILSCVSPYIHLLVKAIRTWLNSPDEHNVYVWFTHNNINMMYFRYMFCVSYMMNTQVCIHINMCVRMPLKKCRMRHIFIYLYISQKYTYTHSCVHAHTCRTG
jgi:hypothetical protein